MVLGGGDQSANFYVSWENILPPDPNVDVRRTIDVLLRDLHSDDWQAQCKGLVSLQSVARHNPSSLSHAELKQAADLCCKRCVSLRSVVSKTALVTLGHLSRGLGYRTEEIYEILISTILQCAKSEKAFVATSAWDAVEALCDPESGACRPSVLNQLTSARRKQLKSDAKLMAKNAKITERVIQSLAEQDLLETDAIRLALQAVVHFPSQKLPEARNAARGAFEICEKFWDPEDFGGLEFRDAVEDAMRTVEIDNAVERNAVLKMLDTLGFISSPDHAPRKISSPIQSFPTRSGLARIGSTRISRPASRDLDVSPFALRSAATTISPPGGRYRLPQVRRVP